MRGGGAPRDGPALGRVRSLAANREFDERSRHRLVALEAKVSLGRDPPGHSAIGAGAVKALAPRAKVRND
jgi:hypothetical protein